MGYMKGKLIEDAEFYAKISGRDFYDCMDFIVNTKNAYQMISDVRVRLDKIEELYFEYKEKNKEDELTIIDNHGVDYIYDGHSFIEIKTSIESVENTIAGWHRKRNGLREDMTISTIINKLANKGEIDHVHYFIGDYNNTYGFYAGNFIDTEKDVMIGDDDKVHTFIRFINEKKIWVYKGV